MTSSSVYQQLHQQDHYSDAKHLQQRHQRLRKAVRRDIIFIIAGAIAFAVVAYVETNASKAIRLPHAFTVEFDTKSDEQRRIVDAGFMIEL